jgi:hypothetical protein
VGHGEELLGTVGFGPVTCSASHSVPDCTYAQSK